MISSVPSIGVAGRYFYRFLAFPDGRRLDIMDRLKPPQPPALRHMSGIT
ncbi:hypothetical protein X736_26935 [Mesorhizobium sp. L2C089B000]|nr:hypothetical protein X736_26935 [Mesorhizobium sp. L2C089B000]